MNIEELITILSHIGDKKDKPVRVRIYYPEGCSYREIDSFDLFSDGIALNVRTVNLKPR